MVQLEEAASVLPQLSDSRKGVVLAPTPGTRVSCRFSAAVPLLVSVTVCGALVVFTGTR
jgi:hypothetical protein